MRVCSSGPSVGSGEASGSGGDFGLRSSCGFSGKPPDGCGSYRADDWLCGKIHGRWRQAQSCRDRQAVRTKSLRIEGTMRQEQLRTLSHLHRRVLLLSKNAWPFQRSESHVDRARSCQNNQASKDRRSLAFALSTVGSVLNQGRVGSVSSAFRSILGQIASQTAICLGRI